MTLFIKRISVNVSKTEEAGNYAIAKYRVVFQLHCLYLIKISFAQIFKYFNINLNIITK